MPLGHRGEKTWVHFQAPLTFDADRNRDRLLIARSFARRINALMKEVQIVGINKIKKRNMGENHFRY